MSYIGTPTATSSTSFTVTISSINRAQQYLLSIYYKNSKSEHGNLVKTESDSVTSKTKTYYISQAVENVEKLVLKRVANGEETD